MFRFNGSTSSKLSNEKKKAEETATESQATKSSTAMDLILPLRVLVLPLRTFSQLAQKPTAKGLITLAALIVVVSALAQYASATKIILTIDGQLTSFLATSGFSDWLVRTFTSTIIYVLMYWLVFAVGLALTGRFFKGREISLRSSFVILGYLLSVLVVLYAVRVAMYLALPPISFGISSWPPTEKAGIDDAVALMTQTWGPLYVYQFGTYFSLVAFAWLVLLGGIAVKAMREVSWTKASIVSFLGFLFTGLLFGLP